MKPSRVRLAVCALLFLGWIGWLVYLSLTTTRPVVLSRPQFLAADLYVIADLTAAPDDAGAPAERIGVSEVVWPSVVSADYNGKPLEVKNLPLSGPARGWTGPGTYILPLTRMARGKEVAYLVTPIPRSPGYYGAAPDPKTPGRIYRATGTARRELDDLTKEFHGQGQ
jgi:hypothetical protein